MCRVFSCVVGRGCLLWPVHSLDKTLLGFALLHFTLQGQICLLFQVSLDFLLCIPVPYDEKNIFFKNIFFCVLVSEGLVDHHRTVQLQLLWRIDLDDCDIEWFALETNRDHSVIFEIAPKYWIMDSFVDYDGYSSSSKGFLPTVVDTMVIWIKFSLSSPF